MSPASFAADSYLDHVVANQIGGVPIHTASQPPSRSVTRELLKAL